MSISKQSAKLVEIQEAPGGWIRVLVNGKKVLRINRTKEIRYVSRPDYGHRAHIIPSHRFHRT